MLRFRKCPTVVEACQYRSDAGLLNWINGDEQEKKAYQIDGVLIIPFSVGDLRAYDGDWIIRGVHGFYPCKPDIFEKTYEAVA